MESDCLALIKLSVCGRIVVIQEPSYHTRRPVHIALKNKHYNITTVVDADLGDDVEIRVAVCTRVLAPTQRHERPVRRVDQGGPTHACVCLHAVPTPTAMSGWN